MTRDEQIKVYKRECAKRGVEPDAALMRSLRGDREAIEEDEIRAAKRHSLDIAPGGADRAAWLRSRAKLEVRDDVPRNGAVAKSLRELSQVTLDKVTVRLCADGTAIANVDGQRVTLTVEEIEVAKNMNSPIDLRALAITRAKRLAKIAERRR